MKTVQLSNGRSFVLFLIFTGLLAASVICAPAEETAKSSANRISLTFSGGHETDRRDGGRPVVLIANALGVAPEVFREAFSHVRPARGGSEPEPEQVRQNKAALLNALGRYGITNDQLDHVSNYYRYAGWRGELWPTRRARGYAILENGQVSRFVVTDGGSGYTTPPKIAIAGMHDINVNSLCENFVRFMNKGRDVASEQEP